MSFKTATTPAALFGLGRANLARRALSFLAGVIALRRQRAALARLDATRLADIGLTAREVRAELSRPLWNAPAYWRD